MATVGKWELEVAVWSANSIITYQQIEGKNTDKKKSGSS
jgi:hypothetical protein